MFTQRKNDIHHNDSQMFSAFFYWDFHVRSKLHLYTRIFSRRTRQTRGQVDIFSRCCHVDLLRCSHFEMFSSIDVHILICSPVGILSCSLSGSHPPTGRGGTQAVASAARGAPSTTTTLCSHCTIKRLALHPSMHIEICTIKP